MHAGPVTGSSVTLFVGAIFSQDTRDLTAVRHVAHGLGLVNMLLQCRRQAVGGRTVLRKELD